MSTAKIRFSSDILRRLGEELNPSPDKGIIELVKNAYDANATWCKVELDHTGSPGGTITVCDNGDGMTSQDIINGWLVLGKSIKEPNRLTRLNRIPSGSKGLGRLAALRMGSRCMLTTRPYLEESTEYNLLIDWNEFDKVDLVDSVELTIEKADRLRDEQNGTEIRLENLSTSIKQIDVKRLARELILLADPFGDDPSGFAPELIVPEFKDLESLVRNRYFQDAEYHLKATVDEDGLVTAEVVDWRGEKLFSATHKEIAAARKNKPYRCPAASFNLWIYILNSSTFSTRTTSLGEVRKWIGEFGGVHFYHNKLRVAPYGNPGNDWLDINLRRVRSPEERPSTNTSIGRIDVIDRKSVLIQKTDRSGFIEDESFHELKNFAQDAMNWIANRRLEVAEKRRAKQRAEAPKKTSKAETNVLDSIAKTPKSHREQLEKTFTAYERSRDKEVKGLQKEIQLYRTLSTAGITAATFAHESSGNPIKVIRLSSDALERRGKENLGDLYSEYFKKPIAGIKRAVKSLSVLGSATIKLLDHEKRRLSHVKLNSVVKGVLTTFKPFLEGRDVDYDFHSSNESPYIRGSEAAIESIVTNLLNNSLAAFESAGTTNRTIRIITTLEENVWKMSVQDNGPGIEGISKKDIWLPGRSTRINGTGLGLTIVHDTVIDLGGEVDVVEHCELGGTEIVIELPILGV